MFYIQVAMLESGVLLSIHITIDGATKRVVAWKARKPDVARL